jgi:hypothetical protein
MGSAGRCVIDFDVLDCDYLVVCDLVDDFDGDRLIECDCFCTLNERDVFDSVD